jgi:monoamine oxidase
MALASAIGAATWHGGRDSVAFAAIPKVLVVGAGIAGLTAAYRLRQAGVPIDIIEARNRVGGRIRSLPNACGTSITVDLGGEFINTSHTSLRSLALELGLETADLLAADQGLTPQTWYFQGRLIPETEIINYFIPLAQKIKQDLAAIGNAPLGYRSHSQVARRLDNTSIPKYLDSVETDPILRQMLRIAFTTQFGREPEEQPSLNLLFVIGTDTNRFKIYGGSDERYQIIGGNDQVPRLLAQSLANSLEMGTELEAISTRPDGRYRVSFRSGYRTFERTYERVLLTLPFSTLRLVSLKVNLPPVKQKAIAQLGYGTNTKLITGYSKRVWRSSYDSTAAVFTDTGFQNTWEASRYQSGSNGVITDFTGGQHGLSIGKGSPESQAQILLPQLEQIFRGISRQRQGDAIRAYWPGEEYTRGSYSCYLVGQWTGISGAEEETVGNLFFAGEHCSPAAAGYMEGGCRSGEVAAMKILKDLSLPLVIPRP